MPGGDLSPAIVGGAILIMMGLCCVAVAIGFEGVANRRAHKEDTDRIIAAIRDKKSPPTN